jgi:hypothetical protein
MAVKAVMLVTLLAMAAVCAAKEWEVEWKLPNSENTYSVFQQKPFNVGDTLSKCQSCFFLFSFSLSPLVPLRVNIVVFQLLGTVSAHQFYFSSQRTSKTPGFN